MQCGEAVRERLSCTAALLANSIAVQAEGVRERERGSIKCEECVAGVWEAKARKLINI